MAKSKDEPLDESAPKYRLKVGLSYPGSRPGKTIDRDAGDVVEDIPTRSLPWLIEQGLIEEVAS